MDDCHFHHCMANMTTVIPYQEEQPSRLSKTQENIASTTHCEDDEIILKNCLRQIIEKKNTQ